MKNYYGCLFKMFISIKIREFLYDIKGHSRYFIATCKKNICLCPPIKLLPEDEGTLSNFRCYFLKHLYKPSN